MLTHIFINCYLHEAQYLLRSWLWLRYSKTSPRPFFWSPNAHYQHNYAHPICEAAHCCQCFGAIQCLHPQWKIVFDIDD